MAAAFYAALVVGYLLVVVRDLRDGPRPELDYRRHMWRDDGWWR